MSLDMNPEIRAQWTDALRSGRYKQGNGYLHRGDDSYCCLGVLCDLAVKAGAITAPANLLDAWTYDGYPDYLPESVRDWAGLTSGNPVVRRNGLAMLLANVNDDDVPFAEIADLIDGGAS